MTLEIARRLVGGRWRTGIADESGGAESSLATVTRTVLYSDFGAPVDGNSFVAVHTFVTGDVLLRAGWVCTQTFNDTNYGSLAFQLTDADNGLAVGSLASDGTANPAADGLAPLEGAGTDATPWDPAGQLSTSMAWLASPLTLGVSDNGLMARDGTAGELLVVFVYIPAT